MNYLEIVLTFERSKIIDDLIDAKILAEQKLGNLSTSLEKEKKLCEMQSQFISMASHEFRTPVAIISSSSDLIYRIIKKNENTDKILNHVNKIKAAINRMTILIETTLNLAKFDSGHINIDRRYFNITSMIEDLVRNYEESNSNYQFDLDINLNTNFDTSKFYSVLKLFYKILFH